jgi:hypothetical protein
MRRFHVATVFWRTISSEIDPSSGITKGPNLGEMNRVMKK